MKATGIVRRIDDLGRVVIPKEIRRTMRIREGDPLEIFVDREGEVILKKYSPIGELGEFTQEYAESLHESLGHTVCITDRDIVIAAAGNNKKELLGKAISTEVEKAMEGRRLMVLEGMEAADYVVSHDFPETFENVVVAPIVAAGDPIGCVILLGRNNNVKMGDMERKMAETAAAFLAKQMEH